MRVNCFYISIQFANVIIVKKTTKHCFYNFLVALIKKTIKKQQYKYYALFMCGHCFVWYGFISVGIFYLFFW